MLQKSCLGEVCQYLWVREITRTSSTQSVGLPPPQPGSIRYGSAALTLPFVTQERNTLGSTGSGNRVAVSETKVALCSAPHTWMIWEYSCAWVTSVGFVLPFKMGCLGWKKSFCLGNTNPVIQNKSPCVHCAGFSSSSSIYVRAGDLFQTKLWVKWYVIAELTNQLHIEQ